MSDRIQKVLATAGVASRRHIEQWIAEGRITVNGRPAEIGQKIDHNDRVRVDGKSVHLTRKEEPVRVLLFRKRVGELVTRDDPDGRKTVFRKLPELETGRWIAVGRLDINTSGLLLMTNSGELARRLTHPSFEISREYAVRVLGELSEEVIQRLLKGVELEDGVARFETLKRGAGEEHAEGERTSANQWCTVTLREGRNREVRRLFESQDLQVSRLIRVSHGPVELGRGIKTGSYREATPAEIKSLMQAVELDEPLHEAKKKPAKKRPAKSAQSDVRPAREKPLRSRRRK
ncbi:MAG: pseudouridine synthase [Stenotrophobium sp.]